MIVRELGKSDEQQVPENHRVEVKPHEIAEAEPRRCEENGYQAKAGYAECCRENVGWTERDNARESIGGLDKGNEQSRAIRAKQQSKSACRTKGCRTWEHLRPVHVELPLR